MRDIGVLGSEIEIAGARADSLDGALRPGLKMQFQTPAKRLLEPASKAVSLIGIAATGCFPGACERQFQGFVEDSRGAKAGRRACGLGAQNGGGKA